MADITITAADVRPLPGAIIQRYTADVALTVGNAVYLKSDGDVAKADADDAAQVQAIGIVVGVPGGGTVSAAGDKVDVVVEGPVAGASGLTPGGLMYASVNAGNIADASPAGASGDFRWIIGRANSATTIFIHPFTDIFTAL